METSTKNNPSFLVKLKGFIELTKYRLGSLVVFSALITYFTVAETINLVQVIALGLGGFLVTSAANGFNQIIEKELDKLMDRTRNRPLPQNILTKAQAFIFCAILGIGGSAILWVYTNPLSGIIGFISMLLYALAYTPLKRITPFSVFVGAFPGALPTLIGAVASTPNFGSVGVFALLLFLIQFVWQFPHFWTLAWFNSEDYAKADFYLLPSRGGKNDASKFQILLYCAFLLICSILPFTFNFVGLISTLVCVVCGLAMVLQAYIFYKYPSDVLAKKLFFIILIYLPTVQLALMTRA
ncbi:MAG: protoheme IX farnesyltransferase [Bacteroidetes bacterium]|nr:protoheme IX farnesyltransferase [Bacteroidota bacterium]